MKRIYNILRDMQSMNAAVVLTIDWNHCNEQRDMILIILNITRNPFFIVWYIVHHAVIKAFRI